MEQFGLDRFALADALSEHWEEMQHGRTTSTDDDAGPSKTRSVEARVRRAVFEEVDVEHGRLVAKTEELERRLVLLETVVAGMSQGLVGPRAAPAEAALVGQDRRKLL